MVQPIQYAPQFIKTDVGAIQDKLNARQGQYDTAYAGTMGAEDQFGQFQVHQKDVDLKNKVIGGFKDRVKNLVDQYGGDYAAASKQLVKEIVNTKQDKFFGLAAERNRLAEEQRRRVQQLGPNAIVLNDVTKPDLIDAHGNYIRPEDLASDVLDREQFKALANKEYGYLAKDVQEGNFGQSEVAGLLKRQIRTGITRQQVQETASKIYELLKKQRPDLPDDVANSIAMEEANSYVGDIRNDYQGDPGYVRSTANGTSGSINDTADLFTANTPMPSSRSGKNVGEYDGYRKSFEDSAKKIDSIKIELAQALKDQNKPATTGSDMGDKITDAYFPNSTSEITNSRIRHIEDLRSDLNNARKQYAESENAISKKYKAFKDIKSKVGVGEAWKAVAASINDANEVYGGGAYFKEGNNTPEIAMKSFSDARGAAEIYNPETGEYKTSGKTLSEIIKSGGGKESIVKIGILPGSRKMYWDIKDDKGVINKYTLPIGSSNNQNVVKMQTRYDKVKDIYAGEAGLGLHRITSNGDGTKYTATLVGNENATSVDKPGFYIRTAYVNGNIVSKIIKIGEDGIPINSDLNEFTKQYINQVGKELGVETKLEPQTIE